VAGESLGLTLAIRPTVRLKWRLARRHERASSRVKGRLQMIRRTLVGAFAVFCALATATQGTAAQFTTLTYNVRGLPFPAIEDRTAEIAAIAPLLEDFHDAGGVIDGIESIVLLQELFDQNYYNTITDPQTISYPNLTAKDSSGTFGLGDGLNMLSDFVFANFDRTTWDDCHGTGGADGSDCDTPKGFSFARFDFGDGLQVDVYNLHADAGQDESSRLARRNNIDQLISAINTRSPAGTAVIVMGDTNSLYTRSPNDNVDSLRTGPGLTDVWVELVNGGVVPAPGPEIESGCETDPSGPDCEMIDKVFYRSGDKRHFDAARVLGPQDRVLGWRRGSLRPHSGCRTLRRLRRCHDDHEHDDDGHRVEHDVDNRHRVEHDDRHGPEHDYDDGTVGRDLCRPCGSDDRRCRECRCSDGERCLVHLERRRRRSDVRAVRMRHGRQRGNRRNGCTADAASRRGAAHLTRLSSLHVSRGTPTAVKAAAGVQSTSARRRDR